MTSKVYIVSVVLLLSGLLQLAKAQGNLVFNGGFDTSAAGWTLSNISLGGGYQPTGGNPGGLVALWGNGMPTASQTISSLTPGAVYIVSGDYQKMKGESTDYSFGVAMDEVYLFQATSTIPVDPTWYSFSVPYTATVPSAVLSLSAGLNGTGVSYRIDNIAITVIPEPSSWALFGLSAFCFAPRLLRRRRSQMRQPMA